MRFVGTLHLTTSHNTCSAITCKGVYPLMNNLALRTRADTLSRLRRQRVAATVPEVGKTSNIWFDHVLLCPQDVAMHRPPDKVQARIIKRRIRGFGKWLDETSPEQTDGEKRC